jgi:hypothetical protein
MESDEIRSARIGHHGRDGTPITEKERSKFSPDPGEVPSRVQVEASRKANKKRLADSQGRDDNVGR